MSKVSNYERITQYAEFLYSLNSRFLKLQHEYLRKLYLSCSEEEQRAYVKYVEAKIESSKDREMELDLLGLRGLTDGGPPPEISLDGLSFWTKHIEWCSENYKSSLFRTLQG